MPCIKHLDSVQYYSTLNGVVFKDRQINEIANSLSMRNHRYELANSNPPAGLRSVNVYLNSSVSVISMLVIAESNRHNITNDYVSVTAYDIHTKEELRNLLNLHSNVLFNTPTAQQLRKCYADLLLLMRNHSVDLEDF